MDPISFRLKAKGKKKAKENPHRGLWNSVGSGLWPRLGLISCHFSFLSPHSTLASLLFLKTAKHPPTRGPLHMLFTLLEMLFSQIPTWLTLTSFGLSSNVTNSEWSSLTVHIKYYPPPDASSLLCFIFHNSLCHYLAFITHSFYFICISPTSV